MRAISGLRFGFQKSLSLFLEFLKQIWFLFVVNFCFWLTCFLPCGCFWLHFFVLLLWKGRFFCEVSYGQFFRSMTNCLKQVGLKVIFITIYGLRCFCEEAQKFKESLMARFCGRMTSVILFCERSWSFDIILMRFTCIPALLCVFAYAVSFFSMISIYVMSFLELSAFWLPPSLLYSSVRSHPLATKNLCGAESGGWQI